MTEDLTDHSDARLVIAISRYRQDALAEAYRRHAGAVYGLSRRILADTTIAEEIVQEVFLRLWNQPEKFDAERGSLRSFLLTQAHSRAVDVARSEVARRRREDRDVVLRALATLIPQQRAAVVLTGLLGFSSEEAGRMLHMKASTVRVLSTRARAAMRQVTGDEA